MAQPSQVQTGPPYVLNVAGVGGLPTVHQDVPALAVFVALYLTGAISNMTIYQLNRRKGHKFVMSAAMFGFCMSRVVTCSLRIAWATKPTDANIAIAAQIFTNVGILVVYVVGIVLAQRMLRARQPRLGWTPLLRMAIKILYTLLFCAIVLVIVFTILSFYTLDTAIRSDSLWIQRAGVTYMLLFNLVSMALFLLALLLPRASDCETFGQGSMNSKFTILGTVICLCTCIAGFRTGTTWEDPRPATDPAWYDSKAAFYVFNFSFEIIINYMLLFTRFDKKFWVPDHCKKPGDYSQLSPFGNKEIVVD